MMALFMKDQLHLYQRLTTPPITRSTMEKAEDCLCYAGIIIGILVVMVTVFNVITAPNSAAVDDFNYFHDASDTPTC